MKNLIKILKEDKLMTLLIILLVFYSECGLPAVFNSNPDISILFGDSYMKGALYLIEWISIVFLIIYLLKILVLVDKNPFTNILVHHLNIVTYIFIVLTLGNVLVDTILGSNTGITVFFLPMSGRSYICLTCAILTYMVRYICKKSIEIKDYQDLTI